jgi:hypothetical protein
MGITNLLRGDAELNLAEQWEVGDSEAEMPRELLLDLSIKGFRHCSGDCESREVCGEDSCLCVRTAFPTPEFYEAYRQLRKLYLECLFLGIISVNTEL